jgi:hypothetical protein
MISESLVWAVRREVLAKTGYLVSLRKAQQILFRKESGPKTASLHDFGGRPRGFAGSANTLATSSR